MKTTEMHHHNYSDGLTGATNGVLAFMLAWLLNFFNANADDFLKAACLAFVSGVVGFLTTTFLRFCLNKFKRWVNL